MSEANGREGAVDGVGPAELEGMPEIESPLADVALVDLLNRVLDRGVVIAGDVTVSVAGVDLLHLDLRLLLSSVESLGPRGRGVGPRGPTGGAE